LHCNDLPGRAKRRHEPSATAGTDGAFSATSTTAGCCDPAVIHALAWALIAVRIGERARRVRQAGPAYGARTVYLGWATPSACITSPRGIPRRTSENRDTFTLSRAFTCRGDVIPSWSCINVSGRFDCSRLDNPNLNYCSRRQRQSCIERSAALQTGNLKGSQFPNRTWHSSTRVVGAGP